MTTIYKCAWGKHKSPIDGVYKVIKYYVQSAQIENFTPPEKLLPGMGLLSTIL